MNYHDNYLYHCLLLIRNHDIAGLGDCIAASASCYSCIGSELCGVCSNLDDSLMCISKNATDQIELTCQGTFMDQNLVYTYTKDSI